MPRPTLPGQDPAGLSCEWPAGSEQRRGRCPAADLLRCRPTSEAALDGARFILRRQEAAKQKATDAPLRSLAKALVAGDSGTEIAGFVLMEKGSGQGAAWPWTNHGPRSPFPAAREGR